MTTHLWRSGASKSPAWAACLRDSFRTAWSTKPRCMEAMNAAKEKRTSVVTQLVNSGAAKAREIAIAASHEFGVPLFDLDAANVDLEIQSSSSATSC